MKRILVLIFVLFLIIFSLPIISSFFVETRQDTLLSSLGKYVDRKFWSHGDFQDYTDFGVYSYKSIDIKKSEYFKPVSEPDIATIYVFIDNFEGWVDTIAKNSPDDKLVLNYSFDRSIVDTGDSFYIYENEDYPKFGNYDVWFFDSQTMILYYFHNNI